MFSKVILICAALTFVSATTAASETHKFQQDEFGRPLLPIQFADGSSSLMLLDTAVRRTGLKNELARRLSTKIRDYSSIRHFSSDGLVERPHGLLSELSLWGRRIEDNTVALYPDFASQDGTIGFDAYGWHIIRLHAKDRLIEFQPNTADINRAGWHVVDGRFNHHFGIVLSTTYNDEEFDILVATGASRTVIDINAAKKLAKAGIIEKPDGFQYIAMGLNPRDRGMNETVLPEFSIGSWNLGDLPVLVSRLPVRDATGNNNSNFIMLGADVLLAGDIALDFRDFQVWVPAERVGQEAALLTSSGVKKKVVLQN